MTQAERNIVWEGKRFWVLRNGGSKRRPVTQIMKIGSVVSESVESYSPGVDGESIAVVRAKWLEDRANAKAEAEMQEVSPFECNHCHRFGTKCAEGCIDA